MRAAGGYTDVVLWGRLAPSLLASLDEFTPHDLAQVLWAYATAGAAYRVSTGRDLHEAV
jgi:hypothetical protein